MIDIKIFKESVKELAPKFCLSLVILFGSQVSGKTHKQSDVDIGFIAKKKMNMREIVEMQMAFAQVLKAKDIEMVDLKNLSPLFLKGIAEKSILLYEEEPAFYSNFKIYALKLFFEAKQLLHLRQISLNKFIQKI